MWLNSAEETLLVAFTYKVVSCITYVLNKFAPRTVAYEYHSESLTPAALVKYFDEK